VVVRSAPKGMSPKTLTIAAIVVLAISLAVAAFFLLRGFGAGVRPPAGSSDPNAIAVFADEFPHAPDDELKNPLGIAWTGRLLAVAEADAGRVSLFDPEGGSAGSLTVPVAPGASKAYPVDLAAIDESRLVVVDTAGNRAVIVPTDPDAPASKVAFGPGRDRAPKQPTAVAVAGGLVFIADATDRDIKVYEPTGAYVRSIGGDLSPQLTFVGGMWGSATTLVVSDSNAGRVVVLDPKDGSSLGVLPWRLDLPRGVTGDPKGRVFVADQFARSIMVAGPDRREAGRIDGSGETDAWLMDPRGIVYVGEGARLYVTDPQTGTVKRFDLLPGR
jgi:hypothetical protein